MMSHAVLPFSGPESDLLFVELNEEIFRLEEDLARFHELGARRRLRTPDEYIEQIRIRRELLSLLETVS
ncbi:MAG: hypothetical protein ACRERR_07960 [Moraxellaceae bacterium]